MLLIDFDENIALLILNLLVPKDLVSVQQSCKWGKTIARHDDLWKAFCADRFTAWNTHILSASLGCHEAAYTGLFSISLTLSSACSNKKVKNEHLAWTMRYLMARPMM